MRKLSTAHRAAAGLTREARAQTLALGALLRQARTSRGTTRAELAGRLLIGTATLRRIELGDPRVSLGYYLACGLELGVPVLGIQVSPALAVPPTATRSRAARKRSSERWFS